MTAPCFPGRTARAPRTREARASWWCTKSRHKDAAWKLIEYLSEPAVQERFHALTGDLPPRRATWALKSLASDPYARAFRDQLERVRPTPALPEWERIVNEMQAVAEQVVRGGITMAEAPAELDRRVDAMLEKRRSMLDHRRNP